MGTRVKSNYSKKGRYSYGGSTVDYGNRLGWWERNILPKSETDINVIITPKYAKRPDLVAYDMYGSPQLQWLVLQYNNIIDVSTEMMEGKTLVLPTKERVLTELLSKRSSSITPN